MSKDSKSCVSLEFLTKPFPSYLLRRRRLPLWLFRGRFFSSRNRCLRLVWDDNGSHRLAAPLGWSFLCQNEKILGRHVKGIFGWINKVGSIQAQILLALAAAAGGFFSAANGVAFAVTFLPLEVEGSEAGAAMVPLLLAAT